MIYSRRDSQEDGRQSSWQQRAATQKQLDKVQTVLGVEIASFLHFTVQPASAWSPDEAAEVLLLKNTDSEEVCMAEEKQGPEIPVFMKMRRAAYLVRHLHSKFGIHQMAVDSFESKREHDISRNN